MEQVALWETLAQRGASPLVWPQALVPRAFDISARVAFSASLTCTPPIPRNPPSEEASATFLLIVCSHALNPAASCGALALRMADTSFRLASEVLTTVPGFLAPASCWRRAS